MSVQVSCPGCGAALTFTVGSSVVKVCDHCQSAVARGDRDPELLGKVAALTESESRLGLGLRGQYEGVDFQLVGHSLLGHAAGGSWDEWYAAFADGRWGWLAEGQGRFYLTFERDLARRESVAEPASLQPGSMVALPDRLGLATVAEVGEADVLGAEGELPFRLAPNGTFGYADLEGPKNTFYTISQEPSGERSLFAGQQVQLADLRLDFGGGQASDRPREVRGVHLNCPKCAAALELRAPEITTRLTCPRCGSLLDLTQGKLKFLASAGGNDVKPAIPLGSKGTLDGGPVTVIGFLTRSVEVEGIRYRWSEYLLYEPKRGYEWLVSSDGHWSHVKSVRAAEVAGWPGKPAVQGRTFKPFFVEREARVDHVQGEFYWKISIGESARVADYVAPPWILSSEMSTAEAPSQGQDSRGRVSREIQWSMGRYVQPAEIETAFGTQLDRRPQGVAPNQPYPHRWIYKWWRLFSAALVLLGLISWALSSPRQVFSAGYDLVTLATPESRVIFTEPFELRRWSNVRVSVASNADNSWIYVQGDFVDANTDEVHSFDLPVEYYSGVEGGDAWSEGSRDADVYLSALPAGSYTLRLELETGAPSNPSQVSVKVEQGVSRPLNFFLALGGVSLLPLLVLFRHGAFEKQRWSESDFAQ